MVGLGLATAAAALRAGGQIYSGAQEFNRDDRERLKQLERQEALGRLGMTQAEQQRAGREVLQPLQAAEREAQQERSAQLAAQDLGQGAAFRQMQAQEAIRQRGRILASQMLQQRQEAAIARDQAEIQALQDARTRRRQIMVTGGTELAASGLELGAEAKQTAADQATQKQFREDMLALQKENPAANLYYNPYAPTSLFGSPYSFATPTGG